ncbi:hypothetical protein R1sor_007921 [Riccia sorocarpa]|uniref:Protein unc-45 homolog B n=1 Tax=Riccia sorocarpa TaxID=122646 RepID=A0ABD3HVG6_9MARC
MAVSGGDSSELALGRRSNDLPAVVVMDSRSSEMGYIMGLAFADEDESPSPRRSFGKESGGLLQEVPARAWGKDVQTGRLSHVVIAVDARADPSWRRTKPQKGVKGLVRRLGTKAWKNCFRPCVAVDSSERASIDLGSSSNGDEMLKESVPALFKDECPGLQEQAMRALLHLSGIYGNPLKIVSFPRALEGIVRLLLKEDEPSLQRLATLTLGNLALRQVTAVASVAMEGLATLLTEKDGEALQLSIQLQEEAASVLANICYAPEGGIHVMNPWTDALEGLIRLLFKHDRKGAQEEATRALVNLALVQENSQKLLDFPAVSVIEGLGGLLSDFERPSVVDNVARAFASLSYAPRNAEKIAKSEHFSLVLKGLVGILMTRKSKDGTPLELAVMTIANLSVTHEVQIQIADFPNVLPELYWCLSFHDDQGVVQHAAMALGNLAIAQENRPKIANHMGMLRALVDVMVDARNPGGQENAVYALGNICHTHEWNQLKIADVPGVMKGLVHLLTSDHNTSSQEQAARLLANLSYPQENSVKIITYPGVLTGLSSLLVKFDNINLLREVTRAFANLTCCKDNRWISSFCTEGLARVLVTYSTKRYVKTSSVQIVEIPESSLDDAEFERGSIFPALESREENGLSQKSDMRDLGDMESRILKVEDVKAEHSSLAVGSPIPPDREQTNQAVRDLLTSTEDDRLDKERERPALEEKRQILAGNARVGERQQMRSFNIPLKKETPAKSDHLIQTDTDKDERIARIENIAKRLSQLAMHSNQSSFESFPEVMLVQTAAEDGEMEEQFLSVDESHLMLEQARPVLPEVTGEEEELRNKAVENLILEQASIALGNLAIHKENKGIIGKCEDAMSGLVGLLPRYDSPRIQENAAWALANLFHEEDGGEMVGTIAELKGSQAIQSLGELLLEKETPLVQEQAARALANLAYFPENQAEIIQLPQGLSGVVDLMANDEHPDVQEKAVRLLTNLTCAKEYMTTIADYPGVVPGLSDLLAKEENPDIQKTAAMCLSNLALAPENLPTLVDSSSAISGVMELLSNDENPAAQEQAAKFIVNIAAVQDATYQLKISEFPGIIPELEKFLFQDENPGVQEQAIKALANLARTPEIQEKVLEEPEALSGIARMLIKDDNSELQLNSVLALKNLSLEIPNLRRIADCPSILAGLARLLSRHGEQVQEVAVLTLLNLSRLRSVAVSISSYGYPGVLKDVAILLRLHDNKFLVESTAMLLTNLATAPENRVLIMAVSEVTKALDWLLSDCAVEEQLLMASLSDSSCRTDSSHMKSAAHEDDESIEGDRNTPLDSKHYFKGQRTSIAFWAATALTFLDIQRSRAITLHSAEAYKGRAHAMIAMGMLQEAITELDLSIALQPEAAGTFSIRAIAKSLLQDYSGALVDADRGIELDSQYSGWYQERGILKRILGDLEGALVDLNKAVELEKGDYEILKHRGYVRYLLHDEEGAREDAEWALRVKDTSTTLHEAQYDDFIVNFLGALPVEYLGYKLR